MAKNLAPLVKTLRKQSGYKFGRPPEVAISEATFRRAWERSGQRILPCATELGVSRDVVRRLADRYGVPLPTRVGPSIATCSNEGELPLYLQ